MPKNEKTETSEGIEDKVKAFLAKGGKITQIETGRSGQTGKNTHAIDAKGKKISLFKEGL